MERSGRRWLNNQRTRDKCGGVSDMTIWRWVKSGKFPKPTKFNGRNYWDETEVDAVFAAEMERAAS